jgi:RNA polymerase sigma-70 factor (ECF subfamily)
MVEAEVVRAGVPEAESRLVEGLRRAEPAAAAELYDRFAWRVHRFVVRRLDGDAETAEEITVQTLVEAARGIGRYDARRASFTAWLLGIASRQVIAEVRRRRRRRSVPAGALVPLNSVAEAAVGADPSDGLAARVEAQRQVADLQAHLSEVEMEVLLLEGAYDLTAREIAQVLGKSEQAINSLLRRARAKARERLLGNV